MEPTEPFPQTAGATEPEGTDGPTCARCGLMNAPGAEDCARCHAFLVANQRARTNGLYARQPSPELVMTADDLAAGIISDLGGAEALSTLELAYVAKLRSIDILARVAANVVVQEGLKTRAGQTAANLLNTSTTTFDRLAMRLGLKRKPRRVPSLADVMAGEADA